jgi:hypothetical protein
MPAFVIRVYGHKSRTIFIQQDFFTLEHKSIGKKIGALINI